MFNKLMEVMNDASLNASKFYDKGNKTAGVRLRKNMLDLQKAAKAVRDEVLAIRG